MVSSNELQNAYRDLYLCMREYLWDVDTLEHLADVELEIFTRFIDRSNLRKAMSKLRRDLLPSFADDEELEELFTALQELVDCDDTQYAELYNTEMV